MSEAVQLALIAMVHDWFSKLIDNAGPVVAAVVAFATFVAQMWSRHQDKKERAAAASDRTAIVEQVCEVKVAAVRSKEELDLAATGAFRQGHVAGAERATGPAPLER